MYKRMMVAIGVVVILVFADPHIKSWSVFSYLFGCLMMWFGEMMNKYK